MTDRSFPDAGSPTYEGRPVPDPTRPVVDQGLDFDIATLVSRRRTLRLLGGVAGAMVMAGCATDAATGDGATSLACGEEIPPETPGPFPADGSGLLDVLSASDVVREDITTSFAGLEGRAEGVPMVMELTVQDLDAGCAPMPGAAVYAWHCDGVGDYSLYSAGVTDQNWLRGVGEADATGTVRFTSIVPGCYPGRWPHVHFEVFGDLAAAVDAGNVLATSQLALPRDVCEQVYADDPRYGTSLADLGRLRLESDIVFADDGGVQQLASVTGSVAEGYTARLTIAVHTA